MHAQYTDKIRTFLKSYQQQHPNPHDLQNAPLEASMAGDERTADALLQLYLDGKKRAGSSLKRDYEVAGDPYPEVGQYWIILDSKKNPRCLVRTVRVEEWLFCDVPEEVAIAEGEGDLSLEYWRKAHRWFFEPYLEDLGVDDLEKATIITEFFEVVYQVEGAT